MRKILSGLTILLISCSAAGAAEFSTAGAAAPMSLIQYNSSTRTNDRPARPQRYICVVPAGQSNNRSRPYVCRADEGRVGGRCRCAGVTGNGSLDLAR
jgi:hypothetical protein